MTSRLVSIAFGTLATSWMANAATYYAAPLSTSCNPASPGTGTLADPYKHPHFALTRGSLGCGDTLVLRGGEYRGAYSGFSPDGTLEERSNACDDDPTDDSANDGSHTVLPIFKACTAGNELVIQNYPGENVLLDGSDADLDAGNVWTRCESSSQCGTTTGLSLSDYTRTYYTNAFNVGSSDTSQIWIDPSPATPGTRIGWWADSASAIASDLASDHDSLGDGKFFSVNGGKPIVMRLPDGSDPDLHKVKMTVQGGDGAFRTVSVAGASYVTIRKNPAGGSFRVKFGYYPLYMWGGSHHITFDGLEVIAAGGRDYGQCARNSHANDVTIKNGLCRESMGAGIDHYGGGPGGSNGEGIQISNNSIENMLIYDTGRAWVDGGGLGQSLGTGIALKNCKNCSAKGNTIYGTFRNGIQVNYSGGNGCGVGFCDSSGAVIEGNKIWDNCHFTDLSASVYPQPQTGDAQCAAINIVRSGDPGSVNNPRIQNNMIRGDYVPGAFSNGARPHGIKIDGSGGQVTGARVVNNSISNVGGACINLMENSAQVIVRNNAMDRCSTINGARGNGCNGQPCDLLTQWGAPASGHITSNNTYWSANSTDQVIRQNGGAGYTRADAGTFEPSAVQTAPLFLSPTDLHLQSNSPLIDAVVSSTDMPVLDIDGQIRPQGIRADIGADEFGSTDTVPPKAPTNFRAR